jgi:hypothetical protein
MVLPDVPPLQAEMPGHQIGVESSTPRRDSHVCGGVTLAAEDLVDVAARPAHLD